MGLAPREADLLEIASWMRDMGYIVSFEPHGILTDSVNLGLYKAVSNYGLQK